MPDVEADDARWGGRLLPKLFWAGVGVAPLAGLLLLVGGGVGSRLGGFLGVLSVVLIGVSIALRPDASAMRLQLEETLLEEIDLLRAELREDIANSARATHQTVGERLGAVQQMVEAMRAERAAASPAGEFLAAPVAAPLPPRGAAAVPSAVPVYSATRPGPPPVPSGPPSRLPAGAAVSGADLRTPGGAPGRGRASVNGPAAPGRRGRAEHPEPAELRAPVGRAAPTGGIYRHTETVQVTRSTYVDEHPAADERFGPGWSTVVPRSRAPEAFEESWTDEKLRERYGDRPRRYEPDDEPAGEHADSTTRGGSWQREEDWRPISAAPVSRSRSRRHPAERDTDGERPSRRAADAPAAAAGGRWASVRTDDRGSELRVGERRASRHSYEDGDEVRIEDRWATVRRSAEPDDGDANGYRGARRGAGPAGDFGRDQGSAGDFGRDAGPGLPDYSRRALPAASSEPSWNDDWEEPVRQSRGHRYRDEGADDGYGGGRRRRQLDFELTDERWR